MFRPVKRLCSSSPISGYAACDRRRRRVAPDTYAVEVEGIAKRFGKQPALDGVSLRSRRGEVYGLLGPNGAGKTTLIRSLVGLVAPERGTVTVLGRRMPQLPVLARVGYMTQQAALSPDISAEENVRFFGAIHGRENGPAAPPRADRRRQSAAAGSALGRLPQDGGRRHLHRGLQSRDGRGRAM